MAFKEVVDLECDKAIQLGGPDNPTSIEGYYLGAKETDGQFGPGKLHVFKTANGNIGVWGKTNSNRLLSSNLIGQMVLMTFTGMSKPQKGKRPAYLYKVQHDEENTIDVSGLVAANLSASEASDNYSDDANYDDGADAAYVEEPTPPRATKPARAAVAPDAARQARVQALLNGNKKVS